MNCTQPRIRFMNPPIYWLNEICQKWKTEAWNGWKIPRDRCQLSICCYFEQAPISPWIFCLPNKFVHFCYLSGPPIAKGQVQFGPVNWIHFWCGMESNLLHTASKVYTNRWTILYIVYLIKVHWAEIRWPRFTMLYLICAGYFQRSK